MKIAHVLSHVAAQYAGVPLGTRKLGAALVVKGIDISFWATGDQNEEKELASVGIDAHLFRTAWPHGWRRSPELIRSLSEVAEDLDLFHIHEVWNYPQLMAARVARSKDKPYILAPRASLEPWRMKYKGFKKKLYYSLIGKQMLDNAACLHAVAPAEVKGFRELGYEGKVFIVHNGIVPDEFLQLPERCEAEERWPGLRGRRVVLFLSRLSPEKGLDQLLLAWVEIAKKATCSDALLVLAGPDDRGYRVVLEQLIAANNLCRHVLFTGMVTGREKLALMTRADIYTLPSYSEGFSNSVLENLAVGTPVLITPACNFPEVVVAGAGVCVEPQKYVLAEALQGLLGMSYEQLIEMGARGRKLVLENFTWEIAARKVVAVYDVILKGKEIPLHPQPILLDASGKAIY
jgi:glycosyltransferase involved in cell wall biosynthesis